MGRNAVVFQDEIGQRLLAAVVLVVRSAQRQGGDPQFIAGVLALAEHRALAEDQDWAALLAQARAALGADVGRLIDAALTLEAGAVIGGNCGQS